MTITFAFTVYKHTGVQQLIGLGVLLMAALLFGGIMHVNAQDAPRVLTAVEADLWAHVQAGEQVRVIVGFRAPDAPVGVVDSLAVEADYRAQLDAARDSLITAVDAAGVMTVHAASREWVIPFVALTVDASAYTALLTDPTVTSIEADRPEPPTLAQTIPIINADDVWALGFRGAGETIAVLDTGVQGNHPSFNFGARVVAEACYSSGSPSNCPNGSASQTGVGSAAPQTCHTNLPGNSGCDHGTHVAGIVLGFDVLRSIRGVAPAADLIAVNAFSTIAGDSSTQSYVSDQVSGLNYIYGLRTTRTIRGVNMSLGSGYFTSACDSAQASRATIFQLLRAAGIMPIVATGNDSFTDGISAPACISTAVAVGATTDTNVLAGFSNSLAPMVTLLAPGVSVYSAISTGSPLNDGTGYGPQSGTSMATPHVAGAFALLFDAVPSASAEEILMALHISGLTITVPGGSTPRIDLTAARTALTTPNTVVVMTRQGSPLAPHARLVLPMNVRVTRISDSVVVANSNRTTDQYARLIMTDLAPGTYTIRVKPANGLAAAGTVTAINGLRILTLGVLREGDANNDNVVNISDFSLLAASFGTAMGGGSYNPNADFNDDGAVNITDFSLLAASFGQVGAAL